MLLIDGNINRASVDFTGGGDDHPPQSGIASANQNVQSPVSVHLKHFDGMNVRIWNAGQRSQMEYGIGSLQCRSHRFRIANVAANKPYVFCVGRQQVQETRVIP